MSNAKSHAIGTAGSLEGIGSLPAGGVHKTPRKASPVGAIQKNRKRMLFGVPTKYGDVVQALQKKHLGVPTECGDMVQRECLEGTHSSLHRAPSVSREEAAPTT